MEIGQDLPITHVAIVSDPTKVPPNYTLIDKTYDKCDDADLWKDGLFGRRVMRYLCVQRQVPSGTEDVLTDVTVINEREEPPPGFMVLETTHDSGEKATKKKTICLRWMVSSMTTDSISELVFLNRSQKRPPPNYTMVGEINTMTLCYKMGCIPKTSPDQNTTAQGGQRLAYGMPQGLPYGSTPKVNVAAATAVAGGCSGPVSPPTNINPISGVQWKMNTCYGLMMDLQNLTIPEIRGKTMMDLERQYQYTFDVERSVSKAQVMS